MSALLDLPPYAERDDAAFLAEACPDDEALRRDVAELLDSPGTTDR